MACWTEWRHTVTHAAQVVAGCAAIGALVGAEGFSLGTATPAVLAGLAVSLLGVINGLGSYYDDLMALAACYDQAGQPADAAAARQRAEAIAAERDRMQAMLQQIQSLAHV